MFNVKMLIISNTDNCPIYINRKELGKEASCWRDRKRECVRDGESQKTEVASVVKMAIGETDHFGIS